MRPDDPDSEAMDDDCSEALYELYEYLDGELTEGRREIITSHLNACGECFEAFDFQAELRQVVAQKCKDEVPDALKARVARLLESEG